MLLLIILVLLLFGGGGGYYGYSRWRTGGGGGVAGVVLIVVGGFCTAPPGGAGGQYHRGNDRARGVQVCVYKDINYQGAEQCYSAGDEVNNLGAQSKSISSIRVYGRATVTVYENTDFRGRSAQFTSDVSDLCGAAAKNP